MRTFPKNQDFHQKFLHMRVLILSKVVYMIYHICRFSSCEPYVTPSLLVNRLTGFRRFRIARRLTRSWFTVQRLWMIDYLRLCCQTVLISTAKSSNFTPKRPYITWIISKCCSSQHKSSDTSVIWTSGWIIFGWESKRWCL